jgi:PKD repeat protein
VAVNPAARSPNLDVLLELRNSAGTLLASSNPTDALNGSLVTTVPAAGTYYVSVQGVGKGDPTSTGYTDYGSLGNYALTVTTVTSGNLAPTAMASATPASGTVPLVSQFSAAGSTDADGSIVSYTWSFGDGTSASGQNPSHTYSTAGTYSAVLTVTDDQGLTATRSVTITAQPVVTLAAMKVGDIAMSLSSTSSTARARAYATVTVLDGNGQPLSGAKVTGRWSGVVSGNVSGTTASNGSIRLQSGTTRSRGTFTFTVTGVTRSGSTYDASLNTETSDSITR